MKQPIRVIIINSQPIVRIGLVAMLRQQEDIEVLGEGSDGMQAVIQATELKPDVVLMDICLPLLGGFETTARINETIPGTRVLMFGVSEQEQALLEMTNLNVQGYLPSTATAAEVVEGVRRVAAGETILSPVRL